MDQSTLAVILLFLGGIISYMLIRFSIQWDDKYTPLFWLPLMGCGFLTLFILPGKVSDEALSSFNSYLAGIAVGEYLRIKLAPQFNKIKKFREDVENHKEKEKDKNKLKKK